MRDGIIASFGPYGATRDEVPSGTAITQYGADSLVVPGFVDAHVHYPQTQMIAAPGGQLLDWLNAYALPAEQQFADRTHAQLVARVFLRELLRAGTTTAAVFCTVFPESVDAFFEESERLNTRMIAGKVLMDRNAPAALLDPPGGGGDASRELIGRWHRRGPPPSPGTARFGPARPPREAGAARARSKEAPRTSPRPPGGEKPGEVRWRRAQF